MRKRVIVYLINLQTGTIIETFEGRELMDGYEVPVEAMDRLDSFNEQGYALAVGLYYSEAGD